MVGDKNITPKITTKITARISAVSLLGVGGDSRKMDSVSLWFEQRLVLLDREVGPPRVVDTNFLEVVVGLSSSSSPVGHLHDDRADEVLCDVSEEDSAHAGKGTITQGMRCGIASGCSDNAGVGTELVGRFVLLTPSVTFEHSAKFLVSIIMILINFRFGCGEGRCWRQTGGWV
jgi:hypothetical protein